MLRRYRPGDRDALYDVCVRTGADGQDARGLFSDDDLLPDVYVGPYLHLEPALAFVVDDGSRAVGYVVGAADTAGFVRAYRQEWLPLVADRHPVPAVPARGEEDRLLQRLRAPELMLVPEAADHPAHLHIDLLPGHQGHGHGRRLIHTLLAELRSGGVPSVHLGVAAANTGARAFYARLGFVPLDVPGADAGTHLWRTTTGAAPAEGVDT